MNASNIKIGDLVMVVRAHCPIGVIVGQIRTVLELSAEDGTLTCGSCLAAYDGAVIAKIAEHEWGWHPVEWLRRIDPLSEPERIVEEALA